MDRNKFLIEKPQSVQKAEKAAEKKIILAKKKADELKRIAEDLKKSQALKNKIQKRAKEMTKDAIMQRQIISLSNRAVPRDTYQGGCG